MQNENEFMGYGLFNDIEDEQLRTRNRAVAMGNITERFLTNAGITVEGHNMLTGYFGQVPEGERAAVFTSYIEHLPLVGIDVELVKQVARS
jgi:hypothetical protein